MDEQVKLFIWCSVLV